MAVLLIAVKHHVFHPGHVGLLAGLVEQDHQDDPLDVLEHDLVALGSADHLNRLVAAELEDVAPMGVDDLDHPAEAAVEEVGELLGTLSSVRGEALGERGEPGDVRRHERALDAPDRGSLRSAALPLAYGGIVSVGIAYTLQVVAQRDARPAHAAILLSMECPFAALGGWVILNEILGLRGVIGAAFMLAGMLLSQLWGAWQKETRPGRSGPDSR